MTPLELDRQVPALIVKVGHYPLHSGGLGAIRTLGRLGVPVYATTEDALTPAALSRYCTGRFKWRTSALEEPGSLVKGLKEIAERIGRLSVIVPADDESAILVSEHADELAGYFLIPAVRPSLPRQLASKHELYRLCCEHGVAAPVSVHLSDADGVEAFARRATFPVVVKNSAPWVRLRVPVVNSTTVLQKPSELLALVTNGAAEFSLLLQEYIPREDAEDWIVHLYCGANANPLVLFTGYKVRSWPPHAGVTACAYSVPNPVLAHINKEFCKEIGFQGIADLDWRFDRRDGCYKLVDFNPRMGNQFRLFETDVGIDVVRALHLDLTGCELPAGEQVNGRRILVEHADLPARLFYRGSTRSVPMAPLHPTETELAWVARDDPMPFLTMWPRLAKPLAAQLIRMRRARKRRRAAHYFEDGAT